MYETPFCTRASHQMHAKIHTKHASKEERWWGNQRGEILKLRGKQGRTKGEENRFRAKIHHED